MNVAVHAQDLRVGLELFQQAAHGAGTVVKAPRIVARQLIQIAHLL